MRWLDYPLPDSSREAGRAAVGTLASTFAMVVLVLAVTAIAMHQLHAPIEAYLAVAVVCVGIGLHGVVKAYDLRRDYRLLKRKGK
jgi:hypothetical protein